MELGVSVSMGALIGGNKNARHGDDEGNSDDDVDDEQGGDDQPGTENHHSAHRGSIVQSEKECWGAEMSTRPPCTLLLRLS